MDNLNIHKHFIIRDLIAHAGHKIVYRAPYWSCDGAIEYVFNTIHTEL
jgi:transposase